MYIVIHHNVILVVVALLVLHIFFVFGRTNDDDINTMSFVTTPTIKNNYNNNYNYNQQEEKDCNNNNNNNNNNNTIIQQSTMSTTTSILQQQQEQAQEEEQSLLLNEYDIHEQQINAWSTVEPIIQTNITELLLSDDENNITYYKSIIPNGRFSNYTTKQMSNENIRNKRIIYFVTPTYKRYTQYIDLIRIKQMLQLASITKHKLIYWIIIEDSKYCTKRIRNLLNDSNLYYSHSNILSNKNTKHRGVKQRNLALQIIEQIGYEGIIYFGDDDNGYDIQLFNELLYTKTVSIFNVGFAGNGPYEGCKVSSITTNTTNRNTNTTTSTTSNTTISIHSNFDEKKRLYPIDMGGIGFSTDLIFSKKPRFDKKQSLGYLETNFISQVINNNTNALQPLGGNCTKILVWHIKTTANTYQSYVNINEVQSDKERSSNIMSLL